MIQSNASPMQWKVGTFFKNPVYVQPWFLLLIAFFSFSGLRSYVDLLVGLILMPILAISVLAHELAHATATRLFGYGTSTIILHGFGGVAISDSYRRPRPLQSVVVSAVGPISSGLLAVIGLLTITFVLPLIPTGTTTAYVAASSVQTFILLNAFLAIFNALPILPLDGGHVVQHLLHHFMKNERKATRTTVYISLTTLVVVSVAAFMLHWGGFLTFVVLIMLGMQNYMLLKQTEY